MHACCRYDCISLNSFLHGEGDVYPEPCPKTAKHPDGFRKFMQAMYKAGNCRVVIGNYAYYGLATKEALEAKDVDAGEIARQAFG